MPASEQDPNKLLPEERQIEFLRVFKLFDSVGKGAEWIANACGVKPITVMVWRTKKKSGYCIPERAYKTLIAQIKSNPPQVL